MKNIIRLLFCLSLIVLAGCVSKQEEQSLVGSRPNIIFVITDDQGMGDLSCMGNQILKTPHLDQLHAQSTRFTDFQVSSTCAPTRAALMSGRHPFEVGVTHTVFQRERLALDVVTFPERLQTAGYNTGLFGKWHLGDEAAYRPQSRGFDEVLMHGAGGIGQYRWGDFKANTENTYFDSTLLHNDTVVKSKGFCTDVFFSAALAWIKQQHEADETYFAYVSLNAPHGPMIAPESYKERFLKMGYDNQTAARYGMIENIDDNVGRLMRHLSEWGALENTLVIFMTDNGMSRSRLKRKDGTKEPAFNAGMRGYKSSSFEGGTHVPAFWYWKGMLGEGVDIPALTAHIDVYPTLCELAGVNLPRRETGLNGRSLVSLLKNPQAHWPDRKLFFHLGRWDDNTWNKKTREENRYNRAAVRNSKWRWVAELKNNKPVFHLSDIQADPGEKTNLAEQYPEVAQELKNAFDQWWDSLDPYLVNEGLPHIPPEEQPLPNLYDQQLEEKGSIPEWEPAEL